MAPTAICYHPDCALHQTGPVHPEKPARPEWILAALEAAKLRSCFDWLEPQPVERRWLGTVHAAEYVGFIEGAYASGRRAADHGETMLSAESWRVARLAVGGALRAVDAVLGEGFANAFSLARPPGHHATRTRAMGFCLFNQVAVAARYAQQVHGLERVAILDWDVHHGNGTQDIFYADGSVHYTSLHQWPLWPGTGRAEETGEGAGAGATLNCPVPPGARWEAYETAWKQQIRPVWERFQPELILISAGFDAHRRDPLAQVELETEDFATFSHLVTQAAEELCGGRVVSVLEGGYDREGLAASAQAHLEALLKA